MDGEYYARLYSLGKTFVYFPKVLAEFRWHGENLSIKNHNKSDINDSLILQKQFAESRAIRRTYGGTWFRHDHYNCLADALLFTYWRIIKTLLKRIYLIRLEKENSK
jgi:hypothetical protein